MSRLSQNIVADKEKEFTSILQVDWRSVTLTRTATLGFGFSIRAGAKDKGKPREQISRRTVTYASAYANLHACMSLHVQLKQWRVFATANSIYHAQPNHKSLNFKFPLFVSPLLVLSVTHLVFQVLLWTWLFPVVQPHNPLLFVRGTRWCASRIQSV